MAAGQLDIALLPVIELARIPDLEIIPGLGIVTRGPSRSVLLISKKPVEEVGSVALDAESRTSNALVRILFAECWGGAPEFIDAGHADVGASLAHCDAVVRIGDKALFEPVPEDCLVYDLGTVWTEATGLPFVFAAWIARRGVLDREIYQTLHKSHRVGRRSIEMIAEDYAWKGHRDPDVARVYLTQHIHCRLGSRELRAIETFLEMAARHGVIDRAPAVRLALSGGTDCHTAAVELRGTRPTTT
jgi:chorismate dehydratase